MTSPRDDDGAGGPAGDGSGTPGTGQKRSPRIEVLRPAPAASPGPGLEQERSDAGRSDAGRDAAGSAAPRAPSARTAWNAPDQPKRAGARPGQRRPGLLGSPRLLLIAIAALLIAGALSYTYVSSGHDPARYAGARNASRAADRAHPAYSQADADAAATLVPAAPPAAANVADGLADPAPAVSSAPERTAARPARTVATGESADEPPAVEAIPQDEVPDASATVRAFYAALGAGDGASAAQLVVPAKRYSGPLSADALSRYYSSFQRPLRVRSVMPVDAHTILVTYDYVLADGRTCRGRSAVDVVQRDGRSLVRGIATRGPC